MTDNIIPDDNIQNTEDPIPENVRNLILARTFRELTGDDKDEKEKRE